MCETIWQWGLTFKCMALKIKLHNFLKRKVFNLKLATASKCSGCTVISSTHFYYDVTIHYATPLILPRSLSLVVCKVLALCLTIQMTHGKSHEVLIRFLRFEIEYTQAASICSSIVSIATFLGTHPSPSAYNLSLAWSHPFIYQHNLKLN